MKVESMLTGQLPVEGDAETLEESIRTRVNSSHVNDWFIIKATLSSPNDDGHPDRIVGWASWLHENPNERDGTTIPCSNDKGEDALGDKRKLVAFDQGLGTFVRRRQNQIYAGWWEQRLGERAPSSASGFLSLRSCFVLPQFQGRGVGGALLRYGCERADRLMLDSLVTSTPSARRLYEASGNFEVVDHLEVDLEEWDLRNEGGMQSSGSGGAARIYQFWFMARIFRRLT
jgi:GNAT superfamily N-acetyltransferase